MPVETIYARKSAISFQSSELMFEISDGMRSLLSILADYSARCAGSLSSEISCLELRPARESTTESCEGRPLTARPPWRERPERQARACRRRRRHPEGYEDGQRLDGDTDIAFHPGHAPVELVESLRDCRFGARPRLVRGRMRCRPRIAGKLVEGMRLIDQGHIDMGNEELWIALWKTSTRVFGYLRHA
jgi:hypothetical protein